LTLVLIVLVPLTALGQEKPQPPEPERRADAEPPVEVRYDLSGVTEPVAEPGPTVTLPSEEKEGEEFTFSIGNHPVTADLNEQFVEAVTACVDRGPRREDQESLVLRGDVGARNDLPTPGSFAVDPDVVLLAKRPPSVQKEIKSLLDAWARFRKSRVQVEVELLHADADSHAPGLHATALPQGDALAALRSAPGVERVFGASTTIPLNVRRHVYEMRQRGTKPSGENQTELDLAEPFLVDLTLAPLPSGRFQVALHLAAGQWNDAERVLCGRRFVVVTDVLPLKATAVARLDDDRGTDLIVVRVSGLAPDDAPWVFYDTAPLLDADDNAQGGTDPLETGASQRYVRTILRAVNERLPRDSQAVRVGSLCFARGEVRAPFLKALEAWERPASDVDVVLFSTRADRAPDELSLDPAKALALAAQGQVLERFSVRALEGARVLARRGTTAWNAAGERQDTQVARSQADLTVLRSGETRLRLSAQTSLNGARLPVSIVPVSATAHLEKGRYLVAQSISREGRTTALLLGETTPGSKP
jgi:hypothetical protein